MLIECKIIYIDGEKTKADGSGGLHIKSGPFAHKHVLLMYYISTKEGIGLVNFEFCNSVQ